MTKKHINNHAWVDTDLSSPTFDMFIWGYKENQYDTSQPHSHDYHEILIFSYPIRQAAFHFGQSTKPNDKKRISENRY